MEMQELQGRTLCYCSEHQTADPSMQRESSATIKTAPASYEQNSPAKAKNIIEIDCRGLEFTEFKADVSGQHDPPWLAITDRPQGRMGSHGHRLGY